MTTEKTSQKNEHEENCATMGCCPPQKFAEMMANCNEEMKCDCGSMMQEVMKGGCCQSDKR